MQGFAQRFCDSKAPQLSVVISRPRRDDLYVRVEEFLPYYSHTKEREREKNRTICSTFITSDWRSVQKTHGPILENVPNMLEGQLCRL